MDESSVSRAGGSNRFVARLAAISGVDQETLQAIELACDGAYRLGAGSTIVAQGTPVSSLHILLNGWALRTRELVDGSQQTTAILLAGDVLDIDNLYIGPSDQAVSALTDCTIVAIPHAKVHELLQHYPAFRDALGRLAAIENVMLSEHATSLGRRGGRERIAHFLCELTTRLKAIGEGDGSTFQIPLTQEEIGRALGLTSVHVNRMMRDLSEAGLIIRRRDRLSVPNPEALGAVARFSDAYLHLDPPSLGTIEDAPAAGHPEGQGDGATAAGPGDAKRDTEFDERQELRHRFKNFISIAQALVNQSLRPDIPIEQARKRLNLRLSAMGGAVDLLASGDWQQGSLKGVLRQVLQLSGADERIHFDGPDLQLNPRAVMALSLALHELQTNALKYGALSSETGSIELFWKVLEHEDGARLWMQWAEREGPAISRPEREGFGTRLITLVTGQTLRGDAQVDYTPAGLTWLLIAPLDQVVAA